MLVCAWFVAAVWVKCQAHPSDVRSATPYRYHRFHANDSYVGQPVPCTEREKLCFRFNMLSYGDKNQCAPINMFVLANRTEFFSGSGHLVAAEVWGSDPCIRLGGQRFAYDGVCHMYELVRDVICACGGKAVPLVARYPTTTHLFGGQECRCDRTNPTHIAQPEEPGRCLIPNLNFPDAVFQYFTEQGFPLNEFEVTNTSPPVGLQCDTAQLKCFEIGQVAFEGSCVPLLQQGPCPAEHVVALNVTAAQRGHVETTCVHVRGHCPVDHVRLSFDGRCYSKSELRFLGQIYIGTNQFGLTVVIRGYNGYSLQWIINPQVLQGSVCHVNVMLSLSPTTIVSPAEPAAIPECGLSNEKKCELYEVRNERPEPEF